MNALEHNVFFGINRLNGVSVIELENGNTRFFLSGKRHAKKVSLLCTASNSTELSRDMIKTKKGWEIEVLLEAGIHYYKFLIDDREEVLDEENDLKGFHSDLGRASVFYIYNHVFRLYDFQEANKVFVAGNFNSWNPTELEMKSDELGWSTALYLPDGTYAYKFIVDGNWIIDPLNPVMRPDGNGTYNSYLSMGDLSTFKLYGHLDAQDVRLAGNFNLWNYTELQMLRTASGWELFYSLAPGLYEYKFVVDKEWIQDPNNPFAVERNEGFNSLVCIKPNHIFKLDNFKDAGEVLVTGTFTEWNARNFKMVRENDSWVFPIYLAANKYLYRYIVDGGIMTDPHNPLLETSEFGQKCSVLKMS